MKKKPGLRFHTGTHARLKITKEMWLGGMGVALLSALLLTTTTSTPDCSLSEDPIPFACDGTLFIFQASAGKPSGFYSISSDGSMLAFGDGTNCPNGNAKLVLNGIGFRTSDGLIYAMGRGSKENISLYQVGSEGRVKKYADISLPKSFSFVKAVGGIDHQDIYYVTAKKGSKKYLVSIDLATIDAAKTKKKMLPQPKFLPFAKGLPGIHDWAVNPLDNKLYGMTSKGTKIVVVDPNAKPLVATSYPSKLGGNSAIGAIYFGADGTMYGSENQDKNGKSNVYQINCECPGPDCGKAILIGTGAKVSTNDGTSCAFGFPILKKWVTPQFAIPGDTLTFHYQFTNTSIIDVVIPKFEDQLPKGLDAKFIDQSLQLKSGNFNTALVKSYGKKESIFLSHLLVPASKGTTPGQLEFTLKALVPQKASLKGKSFKSHSNYAYQGKSYASSDYYLPPGSPTPVSVVNLYSVVPSLDTGKVAPGRTVLYQLEVSNPATGGNYDGAYRVKIKDSLTNAVPINPDAVEITSTNPDFAYGNISIADNVLTIENVKMMAGDVVTTRYQARVADNMTASDQVENYSSAQVPNSSIVQSEMLSTQKFPVEFLEFAAQADQSQVQLSWTTARETNNLGFNVQYTTDGKQFTDMGFVAGAGTTTQLQSYQYQTEPLQAGQYVFRLQQVDFDGKFDFSGMVEVQIGGELSGTATLDFYPNPFKETGTVNLTVPQSQSVTLAVYTLTGSQVAVIHQGMLEAGNSHQFSFQANSLPDGTYLVQVLGQTIRESKKIILRR